MNSTSVIAFPQLLREATSLAHTELENLALSHSIVSPSVTTETYALYLSLMGDVIRDTELHVYPFLTNVISDLEDRRKTHLIENDLNSLGYKTKQDHFPLSSERPQMSESFALGIMYVVEGSTLGGRVIYKNITTVLDYNEQNGASYFAGYGHQTGSHWKNFAAQMADFESKNNCAVEIINGANFAFTAIKKHLSSNSPQ